MAINLGPVGGPSTSEKKLREQAEAERKRQEAIRKAVEASNKTSNQVNKAKGSKTTTTTSSRVAVAPNQTARAATAPRTTAAAAPRPATGGGGGGAGGAGGAGGGGGGGGGGGIKESSDKAQVDALKKLLDSGFWRAADQKIVNVRKIYEQQDQDIVRTYRDSLGQLRLSRSDNEKAEQASSWGNLSNRARENMELLAQAASQGAGETDTLRSQLMAVRNWDANQNDINRSYYDTQRSINSAWTDLNSNTRTARMNLAADAISDYDQIYTNYYNQRADAWTQLGNIHANPYSDQHDPKSTAFQSMVTDASQSYVMPRINQSLANWQGDERATEKRLNNTRAPQNLVSQPRRPEGSTLKKW